MIHTIELGVGSEEALEFWSRRLSDHGYQSQRGGQALRFADYDGLGFELVVAASGNPPLRAAHPEIPPQHALIGVEGARAYHPAASASHGLVADALGFTSTGPGEYRLEGEQRRLRWAYEPPPEQPGLQGAGSVHHIAWASRDEDHLSWQQLVRRAGAHVTDVRDRDYFKSIYFREPSGVLFEIATLSPGFAVDEDPEHLGEALRLPKMHEHLRPQLERSLTPLVNPRAARGEPVGG
jgi:glyoxalase family protein